MEILTGAQMRSVDRRAIEARGIPGALLMEAAGLGVAEALLRDRPDVARSPIVVLCGKGNNGGDGMVAARHLARRGLQPLVLLLAKGDDLRGDASVNLRAARASGVDVREVADESGWSTARATLLPSALVLDALLGTGVRGGARGLVARAIEDLNATGCFVASIDLPSGLDADSHGIAGPAVRATRTYTLCRPKPCLVLDPAAELAGAWSVIPIGIPPALVAEERPHLEWLDRAAAAPLLTARGAAAHKGELGHLLAVAGSRGKSGAAVLLARAALRGGAGLVTVATPASCQGRVAMQQAEAMSEPLAETAAGGLAAGAVPRVVELLATRQSLAIGPGLGTEPDTQQAIVSILAECSGPVVLDADGLNAWAARGGGLERLAALAAPPVLTPHPGEAGRLLGRSARDVQSDRVAAAGELADRAGAVVVLKGRRTLVAAPGGSLAINASGNPGMATGGTGDVLTGLLGALLARGLDAWDAARLAVFVHGDAGDRAARSVGVEGMLASDLARELPAALAALAEPAPAVPW